MTISCHPVKAIIIPNLLITYSVKHGRASIDKVGSGKQGEIPLRNAVIEVTKGGLFQAGVGDIAIHGQNNNKLVWHNVPNAKKIAAELEKLTNKHNKTESSDIKNKATRETHDNPVYQNPSPFYFPRYPEVLPSAISYVKSLHGEFDSRSVLCFAISPHGNAILSISTDAFARLWNPNDGTLLHSLKLQEDTSKTGPYLVSGPSTISCGLSPNNTWMALQKESGGVIYALDGNNIVAPNISVPSSSYLSGSAISTDGSWLAFWRGSEITMGRITNGKEPWNLEPVTINVGGIESLAFHPNGRWLAIADSDGITIIDSSTKQIVTFRRITGILSSLWAMFVFKTIKPRSQYLEGSEDIDRVHTLAIDPNCKWLAASHFGDILFISLHEQQSINDNSYRIYGALLKRLHTNIQRIWVLAPSTDGQWIAGAGKGGVICIWDTESFDLLCKLETGESQIQGLNVHPNGQWMYSAGISGLIRRWHLYNENNELKPVCDLSMEALPEGDWVTWHDPDGKDRRWIDPSNRAKCSLGRRISSNDGKGWFHEPM